jgi:hypothetical protein
MLTFKTFLLLEGGHATEKFGTTRANQADINAALKFVSNVIGIDEAELKKSLLGSTELTLLGKKKDSGDIDIALELKGSNYEDIHKKMMAAVNDEGYFNSGGKIGSYAVPVNGKKVQVDLMFVNNKDWAKFIYHSAQGRGSKYPGAVRNIILFTALTFVQEPGKDFVLRDENGNVIARASRSIKLDSGMERLFKRAKINSKTGKANKTLDTVTPDELENYLHKLGKKIDFAKETDRIDVPDKIAEFIFGPGIKAKDIMTAEDVIKLIKTKMKNPEKILSQAKKELERNKLPVPEEL